MSHNEYESLQREYSRIAGQYDIRWKFYVEASIRETLRRMRITPEDCVLDVGCGTGAFLETLIPAVPQAQLAGVDLSKEMLQVARRRLGTAICLKHAYAEALPFDDATFDIVVSMNVFHFIRHPNASLREMLRVLKPSGKVVITDWCDDYIACRICDIFLRLFSPGHFRTYGSKECREALMVVGFVNTEVERYRINWLWGLMTATASKDLAHC